MTMTLIETITVGSGGATSIEFTGIPDTGLDLLVKVSARVNATDYGLACRFNGDTSNVTSRVLRGIGDSEGSTTAATLNGVTAKSDATANTFGNSEIYVSNYTSSAAKSFSGDGVNENNADDAAKIISANSWSGTAAITSLQLTNASGNFVEHSTASLYLIS